MNQLQQEIINDLGVKPQIVPEQEIEERTAFLAEYLGRSGLDGFALGISGGQDSLLAGLIAQRAVEQRRAAGYEASFHALLLPYGAQADRQDALLACEVIKPDFVHDFDIKAPTDAFAETYNNTENHPITDFDKGNVKARMRMIAHYAIAGEYRLLVVGTDHAAEAVTGFFTKFGDGGADVLPLSGLSKRQGRQILRSLGVPDVFVTKKPTADLLDNRPGQADEYELGLSYETLDDYLEGKTVDPAVATQIEQRYQATAHKRTVPVAYETKR
jgi:NAD+ synthase